MKTLRVLFLLLCTSILPCSAQVVKQNYDIQSAGQGRDGNYLVRVTAVLSKNKKCEEALKPCAVHGVIFKGFMDPRGTSSQKPLVTDPNIEETKSEFFKAFFDEGKYKNYVSVLSSSLSVVKVKKGYEASAVMMVNKEGLIHYLEESGIKQGFSNMW